MGSLNLIAERLTDLQAAPSAATHNTLLAAIDQILDCRFGGRSFLAFGPGPSLETGDGFQFGTITNTALLASVAYDSSHETRATPSGGEVLGYDAATKNITLTGGDSYLTLNRVKVTWTPPLGTPSSWWVGGFLPGRFLPLTIADIVIEAYTDPLAHVNTKFTWRSHWDKYGCVRFHNGNRFALTIHFQDESQTDVVIPPYGILTGRRLDPDQPFAWNFKYLCATVENDPLLWAKHAPGQFAASMELIENMVDQMVGGRNSPGHWCRFNAGFTDDTTSSDQPYFTGATPATSDKLLDWIVHKGDLLSVILDKRDGTVQTRTIHWPGVAAGSDASWSGLLTVTYPSPDTLRITSITTPPAGAEDDEWEHDLVPISTNLIGAIPRSIRGGSDIWLGNIVHGTELPQTDWQLQPTTWHRSTDEVFKPFLGSGTVYVTAFNVDSVSFSEDGLDINSWNQTVGSALALPSIGTGFAQSGTSLVRSLGGLQRRQEISLTSGTGWTRPAHLSAAILRYLIARQEIGTDEWSAVWRRACCVGSTGSIRRFDPTPREFMPSGAMNEGVAVHDHHPQDTEVSGSADGLGLGIGWGPASIQESPVAMELYVWHRVESDRGRTVWEPADALDYVLAHVDEVGWWQSNRMSILAGGVPEEAKLQALRIPRSQSAYNAYVDAVNSVQEVRPMTVSDIRNHPLPDDCRRFPFDYEGEHAFAVPYGWSVGRYDAGNRLKNWCDYWGIDYESAPLPNLTDLRGTMQQHWEMIPRLLEISYTEPTGGPWTYPITYLPIWHGVEYDPSIIAPEEYFLEQFEPYTMSVVISGGYQKTDDSVFAAETTTGTTNGESYSSWKAWTLDAQRLLFGGGGTDSGYRWASEAAVRAVFDDLGVEPPPALVGEPYLPRFVEATGTERTAGVEVDTVAADYPTVRSAASPLGVRWPARDPFAVEPTWLRFIEDGQPFRLSEPYAEVGQKFSTLDWDGTSAHHFMHSSYGISIPEDPNWGVTYGSQRQAFREVWDPDDLLLSQYSSRCVLPTFDPTTNEPAWPDVARIVCSVPCLVIGTPEPRYHGDYVTEEDDDMYAATTPAGTYGMRVLEAPAGTVIDCAWLQTQEWPESPAYHLQIVRRTGILRS